jgi:cardiolipin synthase A/B
VIDGRWATVGSTNLDPLSLLLAREANVVVEDEEFAGQLRSRLLDAISQHGVAVEPQIYMDRPLKQRVLEWVGLTATRLAILVQGKNYL